MFVLITNGGSSEQMESPLQKPTEQQTPHRTHHITVVCSQSPTKAALPKA